MTLPKLAKQAVEFYIKEGKIIPANNNVPDEFSNKKAGVFVTINKNGNLRGCIGTYLPVRENVAKETIFNAIAAAAEDYRFGPVLKEELPYLSYTVYVLSPPEPVDNVGNLDPKKYGVIVTALPARSPDGKSVFFNGQRAPKTGVLLPDLEGIDTAGKQILIACQKSGIDPERENIVIYRFTVKKYE